MQILLSLCILNNPKILYPNIIHIFFLNKYIIDSFAFLIKIYQKTIINTKNYLDIFTFFHSYMIYIYTT